MNVKHLATLLMAILAATPVAADDLVATPADALAWLPTPFGAEASPVSGDFTQGQHLTLVRFKAGMRTPVHTHSAAYVGVVVQGVGVHFVPGQKEIPLAAGSTWSVPADLVHISGCLEGEDCIFALTQQAAFDFVPHP